MNSGDTKDTIKDSQTGHARPGAGKGDINCHLTGWKWSWALDIQLWLQRKHRQNRVPHEKTDNVNHLLGIRAQTRKRRCAWIIRGNFTTETELVGAGTIIAGTLSRRHRDFPFHPSQNVDRDKIVVKPKTIR